MYNAQSSENNNIMQSYFNVISMRVCCHVSHDQSEKTLRPDMYDQWLDELTQHAGQYPVYTHIPLTEYAKTNSGNTQYCSAEIISQSKKDDDI